jgi:hypothetical protein
MPTPETGVLGCYCWCKRHWGSPYTASLNLSGPHKLVCLPDEICESGQPFLERGGTSWLSKRCYEPTSRQVRSAVPSRQHVAGGGTPSERPGSRLDPPSEGGSHTTTWHVVMRSPRGMPHPDTVSRFLCEPTHGQEGTLRPRVT